VQAPLVQLVQLEQKAHWQCPLLPAAHLKSVQPPQAWAKLQA